MMFHHQALDDTMLYDVILVILCIYVESLEFLDNLELKKSRKLMVLFCKNHVTFFSIMAQFLTQYGAFHGVYKILARF